MANKALPDVIMARNQLFDQLWKQHVDDLATKAKPDIMVTLDFGTDAQGQPASRQIVGKAWQSTPGSFLREAPKEVTADVVVAKVNGQLWDLDRPLQGDCKVSYLPFTSTEGRNVFWHSSAHVLGESAEHHFNCLLSHGPPVEQGFFYDMALKEGSAVTHVDWPPLTANANKFIKERQSFDRLHVSLENLKKMFGYSKYKMYYIENLLPPEGSTVYRCGTLVDLCLGPHIQNTTKIKSFEIMKNSSCYFRGDKDDDTLQRVYGVAFPDKKLMAEHKKFLEEAAKRDHRKLGAEQELFFFDELSPGSVFLLPHGTRIFAALQALLREQYAKRNYQEVQSPNIFDVDLWKTSGHWQHYKDDMFVLDVAKRAWALKPMNCPGHCIIFRHRSRSYRELPLRMADFGVLHRNEATGALDGLSRVRKFQQDDAHIFCTEDQITQEVEGCFNFLKTIYGIFGLTFKLKFSTRPEKFLGDIETWDRAEAKLTDALNAFTSQGGGQWELNEGDGAFYGPKIDITTQDALKRDHQCATIQLDFQLPQNFQLEYMTGDDTKKEESEAREPKKPKEKKPKEDKKQAKSEVEQTQIQAKAETFKTPDVRPQDGNIPIPIRPKDPGPGRARPVIIHRAIMGSLERFMSVLIEHFAGRWPFWLSPRQVLVVPVTASCNDYAQEVANLMKAQDMHADADVGTETMPKKILRGQQALYNFILVVGVQERDSRTVNIRNRDDRSTQAKGDLIPLDEAISKMRSLKLERRLANELR